MTTNPNNLSAWQQIQRTRKNTREAMAIANESAGLLASLYLLAFVLASLTLFPIIHFRIGWRLVGLTFFSAVILNGVSLMFTGGYAGMLVQLWSLTQIAAFFAQIIAVFRRTVLPPKPPVDPMEFGELFPPLRRQLQMATRGLIDRPHMDLIVVEPALLLVFTLVVWLAEQWDRHEGVEAPPGAWIVPLCGAIGIFLLGVQMLSEDRKASAEHAAQIRQQEWRAEIARKQNRTDEPRPIEGFVENDR
ncbi:MAG: hypothetical protein H6813_06625 [Phycisphaeraceae bacterium]|nr:hypothetical protein [Phycisphaeraceae bacterium]MCB9848145.1 hypothetical protein [Phycisphaeraceae bacterium]